MRTDGLSLLKHSPNKPVRKQIYVLMLLRLYHWLNFSNFVHKPGTTKSDGHQGLPLLGSYVFSEQLAK
jgi:hypothetical protein